MKKRTNNNSDGRQPRILAWALLVCGHTVSIFSSPSSEYPFLLLSHHLLWHQYHFSYHHCSFIFPLLLVIVSIAVSSQSWSPLASSFVSFLIYFNHIDNNMAMDDLLFYLGFQLVWPWVNGRYIDAAINNYCAVSRGSFFSCAPDNLSCHSGRVLQLCCYKHDGEPLYYNMRYPQLREHKILGAHGGRFAF